MVFSLVSHGSKVFEIMRGHRFRDFIRQKMAFSLSIMWERSLIDFSNKESL